MICDDAMLTNPSGPSEPARANTLVSVEPSLDTEWQATHRLPAPLSSQGGLAGLVESIGVGVPSDALGPESKTGLRVPVGRSILQIWPWLIAQ